jgi:hypothetical protein
LSGEAIQGVPVALKFISGEPTVDDGHVDPHRTRPNTHFLNDAGVFVTGVFFRQHLTHSRSDVGVTHRP